MNGPWATATLEEAFIAGFLATGEGHNGEYVSPTSYEGDPRKAAVEAWNEWKAERTCAS